MWMGLAGRGRALVLPPTSSCAPHPHVETERSLLALAPERVERDFNGGKESNSFKHICLDHG